MAVHFCFGHPDYHLQELANSAADGRVVDWTIDRHAVKGDLAVFYLTAPMSCIVAWGRVASRAKLVTGPRDYWRGHFASRIERLALLPNPLKRSELAKQLRKWRFLKTPRREIRVPEQFEKPLLKVLGILRSGQ